MLIRDNDIIPYYSLFIDFHNINNNTVDCKQERGRRFKSLNEWKKIKQYGKKINEKTRNNKNK